MTSVTELFNAWKEGFENKDSSHLAEFLTDDFRFVGATLRRNETKEEALDNVASNPRSMSIDNLEVIYENDEVAVIHHNVKFGDNDGVSTGVFTKKDGRISQCRYVRTAI